MPKMSPTETQKPAAGASPTSVWYQCQRCGNCCRWPGFVRLNDADITAISNFLGMDELVFIERYTRLRPKRDGLALIDKPNGECVFLEGIDCKIQPVKPHQCSGFPNAWNFPAGATYARPSRSGRKNQPRRAAIRSGWSRLSKSGSDCSKSRDQLMIPFSDTTR